MAISIGGVMVNVGANTAGYEKGMRKVSAIQERLAKAESSHAKAKERDQKRLAGIQAKIDKLQQDRAATELKLDGATEKSKQRILNTLQKIDAQILQNQQNYRTAAAEAAQKDTERLNKLDAVKKELKEVEKAQGGLKGKLGFLTKPIGGGLGSAVGAGLSVVAIRAFINELDQLGKRAKDIDLRPSQLQEFEHQAHLAGLSTGELDSSLKAFNKNASLAAMNTGDARRALQDMGISLVDTNGVSKSQSQLLQETAQWFAENSTNADAAGKAVKIFGDNGAKMLRIFEGGKGVLDQIFNAKGFDEAAANAATLNDEAERATNMLKVVGAKALGGAGFAWDILKGAWDSDKGIIDSLKEGYEKAGEAAYKREEARQNEAQRRQNARIAAAKAAKEKETQDNIAAIEKIDAKLAEFYRGELSDEQKVIDLQKQIKDLADERLKVEKNSAQDVKLYKQIIDKTIKLEQTQLTIKQKKAAADKAAIDAANAADKKRVADYMAEQKRVADKKQAQAAARKEFELQYKIQILEAQGKKEEVDQLKFAKARNDLMERYGYTLKQATEIQKALNDAENAGKKDDKKSESPQFTDEQKKKAQSILDRGLGGTIGKRTLAEAQAVVDGKAPEGGFMTAAFADKGFNGLAGATDKNEKMTLGLKKPTIPSANDRSENRFSLGLKKVNIDAKATKDQLDKEAESLEKDNKDVMADAAKKLDKMNTNLDIIKNAVSGLSTKRISV